MVVVLSLRDLHQPELVRLGHVQVNLLLHNLLQVGKNLKSFNCVSLGILPLLDTRVTVC
jgi:hypothetical protein